MADNGRADDEDLPETLRSVTSLTSQLERKAITEQIARVAAEAVGADLGFVGLLDRPDRLTVTTVVGGRTSAMENLEVERGYGLGGKVLALGKPASVSNYIQADSITHEYDVPIAEEGLAGMMCVPLTLGDELVGVTYVSERVPTEYSDVMLDRVLTAVETASLAFTVADRAREINEEAIAADRQRTAAALNANVGVQLGEILRIARSVAADPNSSDALSADAQTIIESALAASSALRVLPGSSAAKPLPPTPIDTLTARELQVLRHASRGLSNPEIANELYLAKGTIKAYMESLLGKLEARNRVEAVMIAARSGLLDES